MAGNFIIQYSGREGSSAIVSTLSAQPGVNIPIFEDLDPHQFFNSRKPADYPQVIDEIFTTGKFGDKKPNKERIFSEPGAGGYATIGFKWRVNGDFRLLAKVLRKHKVTVFFLQRRDFLGLVCSSYIHTFGNSLQSEIKIPLHPQFDKSFAGYGGVDAPENLTRINAQTFPLNKRLFIKAARAVIRKRRAQTNIARRFARMGLPVKVVFYEDFDTNPEAFITAMLAQVGHDISGAYRDICGFTKVHKTPLTERITGLEAGMNMWQFKRLGRQYHELTSVVQSLSAPQKRGVANHSQFIIQARR